MFHKRHPPVGARPGTLVLPRDAAAPRICVIRYTPQAVDELDVPGPEAVADVLGTPGVKWIDVQGLGDEQVLRRMGELFALHPLALEDVVNVPQRPKTESYGEHQLYVSRMVKLGDASEIDIEQVSIFLGEDWVLTFQERHGDVLDPVRRRIREGKGPLRRSGADYLAYAIIDTIIDCYYPVLDELSDALERMEERVLEHPTPRTLAAVNHIKRELLTLRRGIAPQRDAINALVRGDTSLVSEPVRVYMRDCYDHCVQIADVIEIYRELVSGLLNTYLSALSNRTNEVMKVLTIMASIFIPLTFLAGIYGMNFDVMPELHMTLSYPVLLGLMLLTAAGMVIYFRRRGWIGHDDGD